MQGQQRQGNSPGKGGNGNGTNGQPGQRTLTMSLPPRRGGSSSSSDSDEFKSFSDSSDDEGTGERERAQRRLLDSAVTPHLAADDEEFFSMESSSEEQVLPPDEQALFADGDDWDEVRQVEAETAKRATNASPADVHSGWRSYAWSGLMGVGAVLGSAGMSLYNRKLDLDTVTGRVHQLLIGLINSTLNVTDAAITNLCIDGGLITADTVSVGPLAANPAGYSILCGGFTLAGLELELTLTDIYKLYNGQKPSDSVTLRFGSIAVPLLQVGTAGAQAQPQPSTASSQPSQAQPSSAKPLPENIRTLLAALRLGVHIGTIDVQLHSQTEDGFTCGVTIAHGALRVLPDSGAFKAVKHLTKKHVKIDGELYTTAELRAHVRSLERMIQEGSYGAVHQLTLDGIADQIRAGLLEDGFTDEDREVLQALIEHLGGNRSALADCDQAIKERATKKTEAEVEPKAKQREETARRIEELGDSYDTGGAAGRFRLHDIHGGVVGSQFASDHQTRGELHVGGVHAEGVNATVAGFDTKVKGADVGPLDLRLVDDQVGVHLDGAKVKGAEAWSKDGTGGFVETLKVGETRASARTGDVLHPSQSVEGTVHLGGVTAKGGGGMSGDRAAIVDRAHVGPTDVALHKRGDHQRVDATGLDVDVDHVLGSLDANTALSVDSMSLGASKVHHEQDAATSGGNATLGDLDVATLSVDRPRAGLHAGARHLHVGGVTAGGAYTGDQLTEAGASVGGVQVDGIDAKVGGVDAKVAQAELGQLGGTLKDKQLVANLAGAKLTDAEVALDADTGAGLSSFELGSTRATAKVVDLSAPTAALDGTLHLGALTAQCGAVMSGDRSAIVKQAYVGPTDVTVHKDAEHEQVDASGFAVNVTDVAASLDENTSISADSLRVAPSKVHGERTSSVIDGSVNVGALDLDALSYDRPRAHLHAGADQIHVGGVAASKRGDQAAVTVSDVRADALIASDDEQRASVASLGLDKLGVNGDTAGRDGQLHAGTLTATDLDARSGPGRAHAEKLVVGPTEGHLDPRSASLTNHGVDVAGFEAGNGSQYLSAGRVNTGVIAGEYGPRPTGDGTSLDVRLEHLAASKVDAASLTGDTASELHLGGAALHELHAQARDDGGASLQLDDAGLESLDVSRSHQTPGAKEATKQDWHVHEDKLKIEHAGIGRIALTSPEVDDDGRRDLELGDVGLVNADLINRDDGDRHEHLTRRAKLNVDDARKKLEAERKIAERKAEEARQLREAETPPVVEKKKSRSLLSKAEHKLTGGAKLLARKIKPAHTPETDVKKSEEDVKRATKNLARAEKQAQDVDRKQREAAEKEVKKGKETRTKDRGGHHHVGELTLESFDAELSGFDDDTAHVDAAAMGNLDASHVTESKLLDQLDELTADIHEMKLAVDEAGNGAVTVRVQLGKRAMKNLAGKRLGTVAGLVTGLKDNVLSLTIPVKDHVLQLGDLELGSEKNWLRTQLVKRFTSVHIGGDKARKSHRGTHSTPHLHVPFLGDHQVEHLGLDAVDRDDKKILISRNVDAEGGGLHLGNLLANALQLGLDGAPSAAGGVALHNVVEAATADLTVDGVQAMRRDGAQPGEQVHDAQGASVEHAAVGKTKLELESLDTVQQLMASLAGMFGGGPGKGPTDQAPTDAKPTDQKPTAQSGSPLDGLFAMLEAMLGGAAEPSVQGKPGSSHARPGQGGSKPTPRLSNLLTGATATEQLTAFQTGGGGDCGIHAMYGTPTGLGGTVRTANPNAKRKQLGDRLDGRDGQNQALVDKAAFTQLLAELVLQILTNQGGVGLEAKAFGAIPGFFEAMEEAKAYDDVEYSQHADDSTEYAMALLDQFVFQMEDAIGFLLREQLIQDVMVSNTESERDLRRQLERAGDEHERHIIILKTDRKHLCKLLISNIDVMVVLAVSCGAPDWVADRQLQLQQAHGLLGGHLRQAVGAYLDLLLPAYATVVRTQGYYLHDEDLRLLALIDDLELHIYTESDLVGGQFVEQLAQPGNSGRADVFHSGAHYEQARHQ